MHIVAAALTFALVKKDTSKTPEDTKEEEERGRQDEINHIQVKRGQDKTGTCAG